MRSPTLPDRRATDTGNWLDVACNWMEANPWRICAVILVAITVTSLLETPH